MTMSSPGVLQFPTGPVLKTFSNDRLVRAVAWLCVLSAFAIGLLTSSITTSPLYLFIVPIVMIGLGAGFAVVQSATVCISMMLAVCVIWQTMVLNVFSIPFAGGGLKPLDLLFALTLGGFISRNAVFGAQRISIPMPVLCLLFAFLAWSTFGAIHGLVRGFGNDSLAEYRCLIPYLLVLVIVSELSPRAIRHVMLVITAALVIVAVRGALDFIAGKGGDTDNPGELRVMNFEYTYPVFATILSVTLLSEQARPRWIAVVALVMSLVALYVSFYRGAYIALTVSGFVLYWLLSKAGRRRYMRSLLLMGVMGVTLIAPLMLVVSGLARGLGTIAGRAESILNVHTDTSIGHRFAEWAASVDMLKHAPVFGNGLGARVLFFSPMYNEQTNTLGYWSYDFYMHNSYLWFCVKLGIPGVLLFLGFLLSVLFVGIKSAMNAAPSENRTLLAGFCVCLFGSIVLAVFGPALSTQGVSPGIAFITGAILRLRQELRQPETGDDWSAVTVTPEYA